MPIRINFLAEHQDAEMARRRDPVKRAKLTGIGLVLLFGLWAGFLQARLMMVNSEVNDVESRHKQIGAQFRLVQTNYATATAAISKIAALQQLAADRFLWAPALNAMQYVVVDDVELSSLRGKQSYALTDATPAITNKSGTIRAKPATAHEKVTLSVEAKDYSEVPGDHIPQFQDAIGNNPYFKNHLQKIEMTGRSATQTSPSSHGGPRSFVTFMLECQFPEKVRQPDFLR